MLMVALLMVVALGGAWGQDTKEPGVKEPDKKAEPPKFGIREERPDTTEEDQKTLREFGQKTDGPSLLEYFRKRTYKEADPKAVSVYIRDLADEDFDTRETAYSKLQGLGASALVAIKEAEKHADTEVKRRAEELRIRIEAAAQPG